MANPTTNFGWQMPQNTDLVKDLPADFEVFGQAVDTDLADLKGGTTGQILSKTSNTDLDFTWINNDQGDITEVQAGTGISVASGTGPVPVITNTVATEFDAKGDLIIGTGSDTFDRLAVGSNGYVLTADSAEATGVKWASAASGGENWSLFNTGGTALTGAATITISGISNVEKIMVLIDDASSANAGSQISCRFNGDTGSNYYFAGARMEGRATYGADLVGNTYGTATQAPIGLMGNNAASLVAGSLFLTGCNSAGAKMFIINGSGNNSGNTNSHQSYHLGGYYSGSSTISSVSVYSSTGNFDNGTVYIYTTA